jgi:hypothetical protein
MAASARLGPSANCVRSNARRWPKTELCSTSPMCRGRRPRQRRSHEWRSRERHDAQGSAGCMGRHRGRTRFEAHCPPLVSDADLCLLPCANCAQLLELGFKRQSEETVPSAPIDLALELASLPRRANRFAVGNSSNQSRGAAVRLVRLWKCHWKFADIAKQKDGCCTF